MLDIELTKKWTSRNSLISYSIYFSQDIYLVYIDMMRVQFPNASLLLPGSRTPVIKPVQIIKFLPGAYIIYKFST